MPTAFIDGNNKPIKGINWPVNDSVLIVTLQDCRINGVECTVRTDNAYVAANKEQLIGNNRRYRINTSGSQTVKITAYDGGGVALDSFTIVFTVKAASKPSFSIRIPGLEIAAVQYGGIIGGPGESLTTREIAMAKEIFGTSIRYEAVRVIVSSVVAAPSTLGNAIRSTSRNISNAVMIHELGHIWQFQNLGAAYISRSACAQSIAALSSGTRNAAYEYTKGKMFSDYNPEQQAHIIEDFYQIPTLRTDPWFVKIMERVRSALPSLTLQDTYTESLYGPPTLNQRIMDSLPPPGGVRPAETAPIFRVEW